MAEGEGIQPTVVFILSVPLANRKTSECFFLHSYIEYHMSWQNVACTPENNITQAKNLR